MIVFNLENEKRNKKATSAYQINLPLHPQN